MKNKLDYMTIRSGDRGDLKNISELELKCFPVAEAATEKNFEKRLKHFPDFFWLLEERGQLVAFINAMPTNEEDLTDNMYNDFWGFDKNGQWLMIFGVNTSPEYRNLGCASKLIMKMIEDMKDKRIEGLVLTCKESLIHYYEKFGFVNEGISKSIHGGVIWYQMRLTFQKN